MTTAPYTQKQVVGAPSLLLRLGVGMLGVGLLVLLSGAGFAEVDVAVDASGRVVSLAGPIPVRPPAEPDVGLRVVKVLVADGQTVNEGADLFVLDTTQLEVREQEKKGQIENLVENQGALVAALEQLPTKHKRETDVAVTETNTAKRDLAEEKKKWDLLADSFEKGVAKARRDVEDYRRLVQQMALPRVRLEEAERDLGRLENLLKLAKKDVNVEPIKTREIGLEMLKRKQQTDREDLNLKMETMRYKLERARDDLTELRRLKGLGVVKAPVTGIVSQCNIKVGMVLNRTHPALYLLEFSQTFEMLVTRQERDQLAVDMPAVVRLDEAPRRRLEGRIARIIEDPVGDGPRPLYAVQVQLQNDPTTQQPMSLRSGLAGTGEVVLTRQRLLPVLCGGTRNRLHFSGTGEEVAKK